MQIYSLIRIIENKSKCRLLTCEGEILTFLVEHGPSRPKEIIENCRHTNVAIFSKLNDLCRSGVLEKTSFQPSNITNYSINNEYLQRLYDDGLPL